MSDLKGELERIKAAFAKGLGALEVLVGRTNDDVSSLQERTNALSDRLTRLEAELPEELREKLTRIDIYVGQHEEAKREQTGRVRTLEDGHLRKVAAIEEKKIESTTKVESKKAHLGVAVAIIAAVGSLLVQLARMIWGGGG